MPKKVLTVVLAVVAYGTEVRQNYTSSPLSLSRNEPPRIALGDSHHDELREATRLLCPGGHHARTRSHIWMGLLGGQVIELSKPYLKQSALTPLYRQP